MPVALAVSGLLSVGLARAGHRMGLVDIPGTEVHKGHDRPVPNLGGIAITAAILLPLVTGLLLASLAPADTWSGWLAPLADHVPGIRKRSGEATALLLCLLGLHFVGLVDDRRGLGPALKLLAQSLAALMLAGWFEVRILAVLSAWWGPAGTTASILVTVLWMVAIVNAMNFLDNMDGLAAGVGAVIAGLYLAATLVFPATGGQWFDAALAALIFGALVGFLPLNYPRARLFMGDGGSLVIGLSLATLTVRTTYLPVGAEDMAGHWHALLTPLVLMAIPLYDLTSVTLVRLRHGKSPFSGDRNHFSHRIVRKGLRPPVAVAVIWLSALACGLGGVLLPALSAGGALIVAGQTAAILFLLALLESSSPGRSTDF